MNQNDEISQELIQAWNKLKRKPDIIVFDLDYTLWPMYVDCHVYPPVKRGQKNGKDVILDSHGRVVEAFPEVTKILRTLKGTYFGDVLHIW
jgi:magnesium-dependent phosphatase-1